MFLTKTLLLSVLGLAAANPVARRTVQLPEMGDGVFSATIGADGQLNVTRLSLEGLPSAVTPLTARDADFSLPVSERGCYSFQNNHDDFNDAKTNFGNMCDHGNVIPAGGILWTTHGLSVAFGCSWGADNPCSSSEFNWFIGDMHDNCGDYCGGYEDYGVWKKQYGIQLRGEAICGKGDQVHWKL